MYLGKKTVVEALLDAARSAAWETSAEHPDDIAAEMIGAITGASFALAFVNRLDRQQPPTDEMGG